MNSMQKNPLQITEVVLRDGHQSLLATRLRLDDMLPIAEKLDQVGFWSLETWGGAVFDACIRYLGEDPWERLRELRKVLRHTPQQMLLRGQNLLGYRHYADDVVDKFVERAIENGVSIFRIFDAMNDPRNLERSISAVLKQGQHAQGTIAYTTSSVHTIESWMELAHRISDLGVHSLAIKDMAGLLGPYQAYELVSRLKKELTIPIHMQCHATTGFSTPAILKAVEAGIDNVDTSISSMSMTYGHSATETVVAMFADMPCDTGLSLPLLEEIALYFRDVREKYAQFEGKLRAVDVRILTAQVPGGMLTNMENQLREQNATDRFDEVLTEIPAVRKDLGFIPLVTPTSQIVGTQAVMNVLSGERYKMISKEVAAILKGEYGATPAAMDEKLQKRVLEDAAAITCRPADLLPDEWQKLYDELHRTSVEKNIQLAHCADEDVLIYALFPQIGLNFLAHRGDASAFESPPGTPQEIKDRAPNQSAPSTSESYQVLLDGQQYQVMVLPDTQPAPPSDQQAPSAAGAQQQNVMSAPLAGNVFNVLVQPGDRITQGQVLFILEAMKMETEIRAEGDGVVQSIAVKTGDKVNVGDTLIHWA